MKKIVNVLIGLFILTLCQAQKENLGLNLMKGEIYNQKMNSNVSILQTFNGQQIDINMSVIGITTYKVLDIQNAVYDMEVNYESLIMRMSLPHGVMEFSSEKNDDNDIFSSILGTMKNKPFLVKMTRTGEVNEIRNIETVFSQMFDKFPQLGEIQKQQIKDQIMQAYGEKALKGNIEMCSAIFSGSPVSKGDTWTVNTHLEAGMSAKMETIYELKDVTDNYYQILGKSKIETADKDTYIVSNGMPLRYDMTGIMTSDIKIDKKTGWTTSAILNQSIKGTAYVKDNPQMPGGMAIPMTMNNEMIISDN
jgi:hypothetical protein